VLSGQGGVLMFPPRKNAVPSSAGQGVGLLVAPTVANEQVCQMCLGSDIHLNVELH